MTSNVPRATSSAMPLCLTTVYPEVSQRHKDDKVDDLPNWERQLHSLLGPVPSGVPPRPAYDLISQIPPVWRAVLPEDLDKQPFWRSLCITLRGEYEKHACVPRLERLFRPLHECAPNDVKVVILDDAPSEISADGFAFSCSDAPPRGAKFGGSRTLRTVVEVVRSTTATCRRDDWLSEETQTCGEDPRSLCHWAKQGVLLWNQVVTARTIDRGNGYFVVDRESHWNLSGGAWQIFSHVLLHSLVEYRIARPNLPNGSNLAFLLFGNRARTLVHNKANNHKLNPEWVTTHPAARTATEGFVGTDCFLQCNKWLERAGRKPILW